MKGFLRIFLCLVIPGFSQISALSYDEYKDVWKESVQFPIYFWEKESHLLEWHSPYSSVWKDPIGMDSAFTGSWFEGGMINVTHNCVDRWAKKFPKEKALIWISGENIGNYENERIFTYKELYRQVTHFACALKSLGIQKGDRVAIWLPTVPELIISQLACAKIGAVHAVIFSGSSAKSVQEKLLELKCKAVITADEAVVGGKVIPMKESLDPFLEDCSFVEHVVVVQRTSSMVFMKEDRDIFWDKVVLKMSKMETEPMNADDPLFILYTSGTAERPKSIVHSTGGYLVYVASTLKNTWKPQGLYNSLKKKPKQDVWFCSADMSEITGHSYITYAPLALGLVVVMCEGDLSRLPPDTLWKIIDRYHVSLLSTSPELIHNLMAKGESFSKVYSLPSLRIIGSVGDSLNQESWMWYNTHVGGNSCPIIDAYLQTETGGYVMASVADVSSTGGGNRLLPCLGIQPVIAKGKGKSLCIVKPWPGMMKMVYGEPERLLKNYLSPHKGVYCTGDKAVVNKNGLYKVWSAASDIIKVDGLRLDIQELEKVITSFPDVLEAAVVGVSDVTHRQSIIAFVVAKQGQSVVSNEIQQYILQKKGEIFVPKQVILVKELPKTRSGKIVRRLLQDVLLGKSLDDVSFLRNPESLDEIRMVLSKNDKSL